MAKKKEQVAKKTAKLDDKQLDKVQGGMTYFAQATGYGNESSILLDIYSAAQKKSCK